MEEDDQVSTREQEGELSKAQQQETVHFSLNRANSIKKLEAALKPHTGNNKGSKQYSDKFDSHVFHLLQESNGETGYKQYIRTNTYRDYFQTRYKRTTIQ